MTDGEDEYRVLGCEPSVLRDVSVTTTREDEFPAPVLRDSAEQRMIGKCLEGAADTEDLAAGSQRILCGDEVEQPLEVPPRAGRYFDARQRRVRGRLAFESSTRDSR